MFGRNVGKIVKIIFVLAVIWVIVGGFLFVIRSLPVGTIKDIILSVVVALSTSAAGIEYIIQKEKDGSLTFAPKISNPFSSRIPYESDKTENDDWQNLAREGIEDR